MKARDCLENDSSLINLNPFDKAYINNMKNVFYFASKYLKRAFEKSHLKSGPSNMVLV